MCRVRALTSLPAVSATADTCTHVKYSFSVESYTYVVANAKRRSEIRHRQSRIPDRPPRAVRAPPEPETIIAGPVMLVIPAAASRHYQIRSIIIVSCYCPRAFATPV
jgi:hypothetical protein